MIVAFPGKNRNVWSVGSRNFFLFFFIFLFFLQKRTGSDLLFYENTDILLRVCALLFFILYFTDKK